MKTSEFESRLRRRADHAGVALPHHFPARAERYYDLLSRWNKTTNLTALDLDGYPDKSLDRLMIEPLLAAELVDLDSPLLCLDVGSGGGSPAIPLAIARPLIRLVMVESVTKKGAFLREAARVAELDGSEVITARAEDLGIERAQTADLILIRGVRPNDVLTEALEQILKRDGKLFAFGGSPALWPSTWRATGRRKLSSGSELLVFQSSS